MFEILYQYDPGAEVVRPMPAAAEAAARELISGNRAFAGILDRTADEWQSGLWEPPLGAGEFGALAIQMAHSRHVAQYMHTATGMPAAGTVHAN